MTHRSLDHSPLKQYADNRSGVTFLELIAVVLIIALLASVSAVGFRRSVRRARRQHAVDQLLYHDAQCRIMARRMSVPVSLAIDEETDQLIRTVRDQDQVVAGDVDIEGVWLVAADEFVDSIHYSRRGVTQTYAFEGDAEVLRLVTGWTGQVSVFQSPIELRKTVDEMFTATRPLTD